MTFGRRMREARDRAGLSQPDVIFEVRALLPKPMWISQTKLSNIEQLEDEGSVDRFDVEFLCGLYGIEVGQVSEVIAQDLRKYRKVVRDLGRGEASRRSRWTTDSTDHRVAADSTDDFVLDLTDGAIARGTHPDCTPESIEQRAA